MRATGRKAFRVQARLVSVERLLASNGRAAAIVEVHSTVRYSRELWIRDLAGDYYRVKAPNTGVFDDLSRAIIANKGRPVQVVLHGYPGVLRNGVAPAVWGPWAE